MNWLDIVIAIPLLWGAYQGYKKGLVFMVLMIIGMIFGLYLAFKFSGLIVSLLAEHINASKDILPYIAFAIVFAAIVLLVIFLAKLLEAILKAASLTTFNKVAGSVLGMAKWALIVSVVLWLFKSLEHSLTIIPAKAKKESMTYDFVLKFSTFITPTFDEIKKEFNQNLGQVDSIVNAHLPDSLKDLQSQDKANSKKK
ncbi:MAG: CvpA family protein [Bacteroidia bacterium]